MINHLNAVLHELFVKQVELTSEQIGFTPPDEKWTTYIGNLGEKKGINVYLVELRENHNRRSNEKHRKIQGNSIIETPAPRWLDCHYLISAWDKSSTGVEHGMEPTKEEHSLLYKVAQALMNADPLVPKEVFANNPPAGFPAALEDVQLPLTLPGEGFPKLAEFWGTMGTGYRWKPAVYLVVTLPVIMPEPEKGEYPVIKPPEPIAGQFLQLKGRVLDKKNSLPDGNPAPIPEAEVQLLNSEGKLWRQTRTDAQGRYILDGLPLGKYQMVVTAKDWPEPARPEVDLSTDSGATGYLDVVFDG